MNKKSLPALLAIIFAIIIVVSAIASHDSGPVTTGKPFNDNISSTTIRFLSPDDITRAPDEPTTKISDVPTTQETTTIPAIDRYPNIPENYKNNILIEKRRLYGCDRLTGKVKPIIVFINTPTSTWSAAEMADYKKVCLERMEQIRQEAALYGQYLTITPEFITTTGTETDNQYNDVWAKNILKNAGLPTTGNINNALEKKYSVDESPVIFCLNTQGRACANSYSNIEYVILYTDATGIRHEMYHLYGAADYYYPMEVTKLAKNIFPKSVMLTGEKIDDLTAYAIGWTDTPSATALDFLKKTNHITLEDLIEAMNDQWFTGYKTNWETYDGIYTGNVTDGMFDGQGKMIYTDGAVYEGNWSNGMYEGYGTCKYPDGTVYNGNWKSGAYDGFGTYYYNNGDVFSGNWKNGIMDGYATYTFANGDSFSGTWQNGTYIG